MPWNDSSFQAAEPFIRCRITFWKTATYPVQTLGLHGQEDFRALVDGEKAKELVQDHTASGPPLRKEQETETRSSDPTLKFFLAL